MLDKLYIIILNWNLKDDTILCIESVLKAGANINKVIVVDNGSTDGSVEAIQEKIVPGPILIETGQNLGFAGGVNQGIQRARQNGARWVLLLNNDVIVDIEMFNELEKAVNNYSDNVIIAPLVLNYYQPNVINYVGDRRILNTLITHTLYRGEPASKELPPIIPVDFVNGCAMLIPEQIFRTIGLFNTHFFMYAEDVEFCQRARQAGYHLACATHARILHKVSASTIRDRPRHRYWRISNQIQFYRWYSKGRQIPLMFLFTLVRSLWITLKDLLLQQPELLLPLWQGFLDGWGNKMSSNI